MISYDVSIDNPAKLREASLSRSSIFRNPFFSGFDLQFTDQTSYVTNSCFLMDTKNFIVISIVVFTILGVASTPASPHKMALNCLKRLMPLVVSPGMKGQK